MTEDSEGVAIDHERQESGLDRQPRQSTSVSSAAERQLKIELCHRPLLA